MEFWEESGKQCVVSARQAGTGAIPGDPYREGHGSGFI